MQKNKQITPNEKKSPSPLQTSSQISPQVQQSSSLQKKVSASSPFKKISILRLQTKSTCNNPSPNSALQNNELISYTKKSYLKPSSELRQTPSKVSISSLNKLKNKQSSIKNYGNLDSQEKQRNTTVGLKVKKTTIDSAAKGKLMKKDQDAAIDGVQNVNILSKQVESEKKSKSIYNKNKKRILPNNSVKPTTKAKILTLEEQIVEQLQFKGKNQGPSKTSDKLRGKVTTGLNQSASQKFYPICQNNHQVNNNTQSYKNLYHHQLSTTPPSKVFATSNIKQKKTHQIKQFAPTRKTVIPTAIISSIVDQSKIALPQQQQQMLKQQNSPQISFYNPNPAIFSPPSIMHRHSSPLIASQQQAPHSSYNSVPILSQPTIANKNTAPPLTLSTQSTPTNNPFHHHNPHFQQQQPFSSTHQHQNYINPMEQQQSQFVNNNTFQLNQFPIMPNTSSNSNYATMSLTPISRYQFTTKGNKKQQHIVWKPSFPLKSAYSSN